MTQEPTHCFALILHSISVLCDMIGFIVFFSFFHLLADLDILLAILGAQNLSVLSGLHRLINAAILLSRQQHTAFRFTKQDLVLFYLHLHVVDLGERGAK